jgi:hypothetical protein
MEGTLKTLKRITQAILAALGVPDKESADVDTVSGEAEIRDSVRKTLLDSYAEEYKSLSTIWTGMETKAQGNIAVAGIFIAGVFIFVKDFRSCMGCYEKIFLAVTICVLLSSVVLSMLSLIVRRNAVPPFGEVMDKLASPLLNATTGTELKERLPLIVNDQLGLWRNVVSRGWANIRAKAHFLLAAQICLSVAVAAIAVLTILQVFR